MQTIHHNIKVLLEHTGLTQADFGKLISETRQNIEAWVSGRGTPKAMTCYRISQFFGLQLNQLFEQKLTADDLKITGRVKSLAEVELEAARDKIAMLEQRLGDKEEIINLLKFKAKRT